MLISNRHWDVGQHQSSPKPRCLNRSLVAGCSIAHKPSPSIVADGKWAKLKSLTSNDIFGRCSRANFWDILTSVLESGIKTYQPSLVWDQNKCYCTFWIKRLWFPGWITVIKYSFMFSTPFSTSSKLLFTACFTPVSSGNMLDWIIKMTQTRLIGWIRGKLLIKLFALHELELYYYYLESWLLAASELFHK